MICCKHQEDFEILKALRAHGWSRGLKNEQKISKQNNKVEKVHLADGQSLLCDTLVNAAGSFAGQVANFLGIQLPVVPKKRNVYVFSYQLLEIKL